MSSQLENLDPKRLLGAAANATKVVRGDGTWVEPGASGTSVDVFNVSDTIRSAVVQGTYNTSNEMTTVVPGSVSGMHFSYKTYNYIFMPGDAGTLVWIRNAKKGGSSTNVYAAGTGDASIVGSGSENSASGAKSVAAGGQQNIVSSDWGVISGGYNNVLNSGAAYSFIVGGRNNTITAADSSIIGRGNTNNGIDCHIYGSCNSQIGSNCSKVTLINCDSFNVDNVSDATYYNNVLLKTDLDTRLTANTTTLNLLRGSNNTYSGSNSIVFGGELNAINNKADAFIAGGYNNIINANYSAVMGGIYNVINSICSVAGGQSCIVGGDSSFAIGYHNVANGFRSASVGGDTNKTTGSNAATVGGTQNIAGGTNSFVTGSTNVCNADNSTILGGSGNTIDSGCTNTTLIGCTDLHVTTGTNQCYINNIKIS